MKKKIVIEGMSCMHCVARVEKSLKALEGATNVTVNLEEKTAIVESDSDIEDSKLKETVEDAGYDVVSIESI